MTRSTSRLLLLTFYSCLIAPSLATQCYYPDGTSAPARENYVACDAASSDGFSTCCGPEDACTTNGFCKWSGFKANNLLWRNGCTDPSFNSPNCAKYCTKDPATGKKYDTSQLLYACSETTYCCSAWRGTPVPVYGGSTVSNYSCCNDPSQVFDAGPANFLSIAGFTTSMFPATATGVVSTRIPATMTAVTTALTSSSSFNSSTGIMASTASSNSSTAIAGKSATSSSPSSTQGTSNSSQQQQDAATTSSSDLSTAAKAGIAIGAVAVAILTIIAAAWLMLKYRQQRLQTQASHNEVVEKRTQSPSSSFDGVVPWQAQEQQRPVAATTYAHEIGDGELNEMYAGAGRPNELATETRPKELDANRFSVRRELP